MLAGAVKTGGRPVRQGPLSFAFADPRTRVVASISFIARLPSGMIGILLPLLALGSGLSPALAGVSLAAFRVAQVVATPIWGRLGDAIPLRFLLRLACTAYGAIAAALAMLDVDSVVLVAGAGMLGLVTLPFSALMRAFWNRQPDLVERQLEANVFESFLTEGVLLAGRSVIALAALYLSIEYVALGQAVLACTGGIALSFTVRVRRDRPLVPDKEAVPGYRSAWWRTVSGLYGIYLLLSISLGAFSFALILLFNTRSNGDSWAAAAIILWGLGSLVGAGPITRQFSEYRLRGAALLLIVMGIIQGSAAFIPSALVLCMGFIAGLPISAIVSMLFVELGKTSGISRQGVAFAWATTALFIGDALGTAAAGVVDDIVAWRPAVFIVGAVAASLGGCVAMMMRRISASPSD